MNKLNEQCGVENGLSSGMGGFMKGTLVETEEGWTPIDELKVGEVVNTFRYEDKEVVMLRFSQFPKRNRGGRGIGCYSQSPVLRVWRHHQPDS